MRCTTHYLSRYLSLKALCLAAYFVITACAITACAITPTSITKQPTTTLPVSTPYQTGANGAIFVASAYKPMFEDRRPRFLGDILTINIVENTTANKSGKNTSSKKGSVKGSVSKSFGSPVPRSVFEGSSADSYDDQSDSDASNKFSGSVTVTVTDVLSNGNLVVSGEKQIAFDNGTEFVRFSGVVNPDNVTRGNVVPSNRVADARIEYRSNSKLDTAQVLSILSRFFMSFLPI